MIITSRPSPPPTRSAIGFVHDVVHLAGYRSSDPSFHKGCNGFYQGVAYFVTVLAAMALLVIAYWVTMFSGIGWVVSQVGATGGWRAIICFLLISVAVTPTSFLGTSSFLTSQLTSMWVAVLIVLTSISPPALVWWAAVPLGIGWAWVYMEGIPKACKRWEGPKAP